MILKLSACGASDRVVVLGDRIIFYRRRAVLDSDFERNVEIDTKRPQTIPSAVYVHQIAFASDAGIRANRDDRFGGGVELHTIPQLLSSVYYQRLGKRNRIPTSRNLANRLFSYQRAFIKGSVDVRTALEYFYSVCTCSVVNGRSQIKGYLC